MTVSTTNNRINQVADGVAVSFVYDYVVNDASHMLPYFDNVLQVAGFTVNGVGNQLGGDVTFDVAPANGVIVTLQRVIPLTQLVDYLPYDPFPAETHEDALDKLTLQLQQVSDEISRAIKADVSLPINTSYSLPIPVAGLLMAWNVTEDGLVNVDVSSAGLIVATPYTESFLLSIDAIEARAILEAASISSPNTFSGDNIFNGDDTHNGINIFNEKVKFNKVMHQQIGSNIESATALPNVTDGNYAHVTSIPAGISGATQANPIVVTAVGHNLANGEKVTLSDVGGMTEINGIEYTVANITGTTFELAGIDGTAFTLYTAGGSIQISITSIDTTGEVGTIIYREFDEALTLTHDAVNLILFGSLNIQAAAGDVAKFIEYASGDFKLLSYTRLNGNDFIQEVRFVDNDFASGTTKIPVDDTIPQSNEGDEYMSITITPKKANSKLIIEFNGYFSHSATGAKLVAALFQDAAPDALMTSRAAKATSSNVGNTSVLIFKMIAGTTLPTTFKIRAGESINGTLYFNGSAGNRLYGGTLHSFLKVTEVLA